MLKIRRPLGRLIFNMGIAIPAKTVFLIETAPWITVHEKLSSFIRHVRYLSNGLYIFYSNLWNLSSDIWAWLIVANGNVRCVWWFSWIWINSLAPGRFEWNFTHVIFKLMLVIDGWGIPCEIALIWMSLDFTDDQSTLVQVMAWCHQAASHYQCWPRSLSPYGITRPQSMS